MKILNLKTNKIYIEKSNNKYQNPIIGGYASVFDHIDSHGDRIKKGAFAGTDFTQIKFLWQHDPAQPIGKILRAYEDEYGFYFRSELFLELAKAKEAYELAKNGVVDSFSIGYQLIQTSQADAVRVIEKLKLIEISLVTFPANNQAQLTYCKDFELENSLTRALSIISS